MEKQEGFVQRLEAQVGSIPNSGDSVQEVRKIRKFIAKTEKYRNTLRVIFPDPVVKSENLKQGDKLVISVRRKPKARRKV